MEHKSHVTDDSESHNAALLFKENCQEPQDSYLYIFLDIFSFILTTSDGCLVVLPRLRLLSGYNRSR
jgi:hypothetical protein